LHFRRITRIRAPVLCGCALESENGDREMATSRRGSPELFIRSGITVEIDIFWFVIFFLILWSASAGYFPVEYPAYSAANY
jgi:hypothetical protein